MPVVQTLHSHHIFLFPFKWKSEKSIEALRPLIEKSWTRQTSFSLSTVAEFNEYNYFHDFVRPILYDLDNSPLKHIEHDDTFLDHYAHPILGDGETDYCIKTKDKTYKLKIDRLGVLLHIYSLGVGVLSFHLSNHEDSQASEEDILAINQYGRRTYPPFFALPKEAIGTTAAFIYNNFEEGLRLSQEKELAQSIWFEKAKTPLGGYAEDFSRYKDATYFKEDPFLIPLFIEKLFPERFFSIKTEGAKPVFDDRMFVLCWYGNDSFAKKLSENREYLKDGWWYRFVFVDGSTKTCQNDEMIEEQLKKSVNPRWSGYRTFYGASRYSFVCLTDTLKTLKTNDAEFIVHHFQTIYYKMVELVLLQRACLLHFSDKVTDISSKLGGDETTLNQDVNVLYQEYIRFVNKIYFREITAQEQGIELYNLLQTQMGIAENVAALDNEIKELHDYVSLKEDRKRNELDNERNKLESQRNDRIEWLTKITTAFGIAGLIMAFFGMNYFGKETFVFWNTGGGIDFSVITTVVGIGFIVSVVSYFTYNKIINHMINKFKK